MRRRIVPAVGVEGEPIERRPFFVVQYRGVSRNLRRRMAGGDDAAHAHQRRWRISLKALHRAVDSPRACSSGQAQANFSAQFRAPGHARPAVIGVEKFDAESQASFLNVLAILGECILYTRAD